jgi:hypothetical protein
MSRNSSRGFSTSPFLAAIAATISTSSFMRGDVRARRTTIID